MKKIILLCMSVMMTVFIVACDVSNIQPNSDIGDLNAMDHYETNPNQSGQHEEQIHVGTPLFQNKEFFNIDELIAWIQTEDIENFQDGRYNNGISSLRDRGKVLIPYFANLNMPSPRIEVFPDSFHPDGSTVIGFYYYVGEETIVIPIEEMKSSSLERALNEGMDAYLKVQYGIENAVSPIITMEIETNEVRASIFSNEHTITNGSHFRNGRTWEVSYAIVEDIDSTGRSVNWAILLTDDFEIRMIQSNDNLSEDYLNNLSLHTITINN